MSFDERYIKAKQSGFLTYNLIYSVCVDDDHWRDLTGFQITAAPLNGEYYVSTIL